MSPADRLTRKKVSFFDLYAQQCQHLIMVGTKLRDLMAADSADRKQISKEIHDVEHQADEVSHQLITKISKTFVTPFDRDDMYALSNMLDDCVDEIDEAADLTVLYKMDQILDGMREQAEIILRCCELTANIPQALEKKDKALKEYWLGINQLENQGDRVYRRLLAQLFETATDPIYVIKAKDLIECLETTIDDFEHLAELVEVIMVKES